MYTYYCHISVLYLLLLPRFSRKISPIHISLPSYHFNFLFLFFLTFHVKTSLFLPQHQAAFILFFCLSLFLSFFLSFSLFFSLSFFFLSFFLSLFLSLKSNTAYSRKKLFRPHVVRQNGEEREREREREKKKREGWPGVRVGRQTLVVLERDRGKNPEKKTFYQSVPTNVTSTSST